MIVMARMSNSFSTTTILERTTSLAMPSCIPTRVLAKLVEERHARGPDKPDRGGVHADEHRAHPGVLPRTLPEGHEGVDEHDARAEEAEEPEEAARRAGDDGAQKGGEVE